MLTSVWMLQLKCCQWKGSVKCELPFPSPDYSNLIIPEDNLS